VTQRMARVTSAVAPVTSARTVVWSLRSAMPRAGSGPSGALAFSASNRDPEVRHSLGFPADFAGSETAALVSHLLMLLPPGSPATPRIRIAAAGEGDHTRDLWRGWREGKPGRALSFANVSEVGRKEPDRNGGGLQNRVMDFNGLARKPL
jgi:hypothetical protein